MKTMTFEELVARKIQRDNDRMKVLELELPNTNMTLKMIKPKEQEIFDLLDNMENINSMSENMGAADKLIYLCCPALQDEKLHKEIGAVDPYDTVALIFNISERQYIGEKLQEFCGIVGLEEQVKN